jgi:hypothetical protein
MGLAFAACLASGSAFAGYNDGHITGMAFAGPNTVQEGSTFGLQVMGDGMCSIVIHYDAANIHLQKQVISNSLPSTFQMPTTQLSHFWADPAPTGKLIPGTYQITLEAKMWYGNAPCPAYAAPLQLTVTPAPQQPSFDLTQHANGLGVHAQNPGPTVSYNPPFTPGTPVFWQLFVPANFGKCMVDVAITGPENFNFPGTVIDFVYKGNFTVNKAGKYTVTMATSANAPIEEKCKGGPISYSFNVEEPLIKSAAEIQKIGVVQTVPTVTTTTLPKPLPVHTLPLPGPQQTQKR